MKRVLLVGGAGYLGSILTRVLLNRGYTVRVLDCLYYGDYGLREVRDRIELVVGDLRTVGSSVLNGIDGVINIGGLSNDPTAEYDPEANYEINTLAAERFACMCKEAGIRRHIFASSCSIYDRGMNDLECDDVVQCETADVLPKAAYSCSKYEAERRLLTLADEDFCPVILRKGTIYGFSPRMRYDLVVNTFVKDALSSGRLILFNEGNMWRPLIDVRDVAYAYRLCLEAPTRSVQGQIFNVSYANYRISELASHVRDVLNSTGVTVDLNFDHSTGNVRTYRVSTKKIRRTLGFKPVFSVEEAVLNILHEIPRCGCDDFDNPLYYNIQWMKHLKRHVQLSKKNNIPSTKHQIKRCIPRIYSV